MNELLNILQVDNIIDEERHSSTGRCWENPANPIDCLDSPFGGHGWTDAGISVTHFLALTFAPVWQAVSLISGDVAKLCMHLCRRIEADTKERLFDHPLTDLVCKQPNPQLNAVRFWRRTVLHYLMYGNAYIWVRRDPFTGDPFELIHLLPDRTWSWRDTSTDAVDEPLPMIRYVGGTGNTLQVFELPQSEVIHIEWLHNVSKDHEGLDTTHMAKNSWGLGLAQELFSNKFFFHGGKIGGTLTLPDSMTKASKDNVESSFRKVYTGADKAFRVLVLRDNASFDHGAFNFREAQMVEGSEQQARQTARWFNLPPDKLGVTGAASYNSKAEDNRNYIDNTLGIILRSIAGGCDERLLKPNQRRRHFFEHDIRHLIEPDPPARADMAVKLFGGDIATLNESRALMDLKPIKGGDQRKSDLLPEASEPLLEDDSQQQQNPPDPPPRDRSAVLDVLYVALNRAREANTNLGRLKPFASTIIRSCVVMPSGEWGITN